MYKDPYIQLNLDFMFHIFLYLCIIYNFFHHYLTIAAFIFVLLEFVLMLL